MNSDNRLAFDKAMCKNVMAAVFLDAVYMRHEFDWITLYATTVEMHKKFSVLYSSVGRPVQSSVFCE